MWIQQVGAIRVVGSGGSGRGLKAAVDTELIVVLMVVDIDVDRSGLKPRRQSYTLQLHDTSSVAHKSNRHPCDCYAERA
jgi:hypothetical protein